MATTTVSDAVILPQSQGTGLSGENATIDAAINGVLNRYIGGEYVSSTYSTGLAFQNHNGTNDTVEVGPGIVFVQDDSTSTSGERGSGGNPQAESSTTSGYDTELPEGHTYAVLLPTATEINVSDSTLNEVYVDINDVTANNSVNIEHDGSTTASPGNTSLKIGETNPDDASGDTRANDDASPTFDSLTVNGITDTDALNATESIRGSSLDLSNDPQNPTIFTDYTGNESIGSVEMQNDVAITADNTNKQITRLRDSSSTMPITFTNGTILVSGRGASEFYDRVEIVGAAVDTVDNFGAGVTRSYSTNFDDLFLSIDDSSNNYNIHINGVGFQ